MSCPETDWYFFTGVLFWRLSFHFPVPCTLRNGADHHGSQFQSTGNVEEHSSRASHYSFWSCYNSFQIYLPLPGSWKLIRT